MPRDIEPEVNFLENVYLYNIDDLQAIADDYLEAAPGGNRALRSDHCGEGEAAADAAASEPRIDAG